ncbi:hypothetical protein F1649_02755 [Arcticibacter tournemirensis]|uniref:Uncharacterized protein n=1 Tax=Arcticibacter tournemirensis TaxID=699437 RepID=A0A5M9HKE7_9SPHI|nr:hypothetical protein [Arcticibacter tournemirensis]KAA8485931.1 hypothetical protein F1649_02755 [Arcticibacter tournemirensis]
MKQNKYSTISKRPTVLLITDLDTSSSDLDYWPRAIRAPLLNKTIHKARQWSTLTRIGIENALQ